MRTWYLSLVFVFTLISPLLAFAQSSDAGQKLIREARDNYGEERLNLYLQAFKFGVGQGKDYLNAAYDLIQADRAAEAPEYLQKAADKGSIDTEWLIKDETFSALRESAEFRSCFEKIKANREAFLAKIASLRKQKIENVVPYQKDFKWGFLNKSSFKPLTEAIFDEASFNSEYWYGVFEGQIVYIYPDSISIESNEQLVYAMDIPDFGHTPYIDVRDWAEVKGFEVDKWGNLTNLSSSISISKIGKTSKTYKDSRDQSKIKYYLRTNPFKYGDAWYAIVSVGEKYGVMHQNGTIYAKAPLVYQNLKRIDFVENPLFYYEDSNGNRGFIDMEGKKYFHQQFDRLVEKILFEYDKLQLTTLKNQYRVIDMKTMTWLTPPVPFVITNYERIEIPSKSGEKTFLYYFLCEENGQEFYMDNKGVKYLPK